MERARGGVPSVGVVKRWVLRGLWRRLVGVGIIGPGLLGAPAFILHCWPRCSPLPTSTTRPLLCASSALRRSVCGATMTTPGGTSTLGRHEHSHCARPTGFSHRVGSGTLLNSGPSLCPSHNGGAPHPRSPFPLLAGMEAHILCEEIPHLG